jgi:hypothetical protein
MSPDQHSYWRGVVLYSLCEWLEIPKEDYEKASRRIHNALKKALGVKSFRDLSVAEFEKIASIVRMYWARKGWMIPEPDEKGMNLIDMSMCDFLKHKKLI